MFTFFGGCVFFEWVGAILVISGHPTKWSTVKLRKAVAAFHFMPKRLWPEQPCAHPQVNPEW